MRNVCVPCIVWERSPGNYDTDTEMCQLPAEEVPFILQCNFCNSWVTHSMQCHRHLQGLPA